MAMPCFLAKMFMRTKFAKVVKNSWTFTLKIILMKNASNNWLRWWCMTIKIIASLRNARATHRHVFLHRWFITFGKHCIVSTSRPYILASILTYPKATYQISRRNLFWSRIVASIALVSFLNIKKLKNLLWRRCLNALILQSVGKFSNNIWTLFDHINARATALGSARLAWDFFVLLDAFVIMFL